MKNTVKKHGNADAYRVFLRSLAQKGRFLSELSLWNAALFERFLLFDHFHQIGQRGFEFHAIPMGRICRGIPDAAAGKICGNLYRFEFTFLLHQAAGEGCRKDIAGTVITLSDFGVCIVLH